MAVNLNQNATLANLKQTVENMKVYIDSDKTVSIKGYLKENNTHKFYNTTTPTADTTPIFSFDVATEYFLDQTKTTFVQEFAWSDTTYAGSTNPNLEGKPVFVLAVKGENSVSYSFVNLETLVNTYKTKNTATLSLDIADNEISGNVNISAEEGNAVVAKSDGLYVPTTAETKVSEAENNAIEVKQDGLYVSTVSETKISETEGNQIISNDDGIYVGLNEKVLTMAEYEALSDEEKASDVTYYVSDYTSDEEGGSSADMSDYIKKDSIVTTIDDDSTDDQIPSAMAVYTELSKKVDTDDVIDIINDASSTEIPNANAVRAFVKTTIQNPVNISMDIEDTTILCDDGCSINTEQTIIRNLYDRIDMRIVIDVNGTYNEVTATTPLLSIDVSDLNVVGGIYNFTYTGYDGGWGLLQGRINSAKTNLSIETIDQTNFGTIAGEEPMIIQGTIFLES